jgi:hypothetical protein
MPKKFSNSYDALRREVRVALRRQHPEWIETDGTSVMCDDYEARFAETLQILTLQKRQPQAQRETPLYPFSIASS